MNIRLPFKTATTVNGDSIKSPVNCRLVKQNAFEIALHQEAIKSSAGAKINARLLL